MTQIHGGVIYIPQMYHELGRRVYPMTPLEAWVLALSATLVESVEVVAVLVVAQGRVPTVIVVFVLPVGDHDPGVGH